MKLCMNISHTLARLGAALQTFCTNLGMRTENIKEPNTHHGLRRSVQLMAVPLMLTSGRHKPSKHTSKLSTRSKTKICSRVIHMSGHWVINQNAAHIRSVNTQRYSKRRDAFLNIFKITTTSQKTTLKLTSYQNNLQILASSLFFACRGRA